MSHSSSLRCIRLRAFAQRQRARLVLLGGSLLLPTQLLAAGAQTFVEFSTAAPQGLFGGSWNPQVLDREFFGISDGRPGESNEWNFGGGFDLGVVYAGGSTSGRVGLEFDLNVDAGSLGAYAPYDAGFNFSYANFAPGNFAALTPVATLRNNASLETTSPNFEFRADLVFEAATNIYAGACIDLLFTSACGGFDTGNGLNISKQTLELFSLGPDAADNNAIKAQLLPQLQALYDQARPYVDAAKTGANIADAKKAAGARDPATGQLLSKTDRAALVLDSLFDVGISQGPLASAAVRAPELGNTGGKVGNLIQSNFAADDFLNINVDIDNTLTSTGLLPIPLELALSIDAGIAEAGVSGSLVDLDLNADIGIRQRVTLDPTLTMNLDMHYADGSAVTIKKGIGDLTAVAPLVNQTGVSLVVGTDNFEVLWEGSEDLAGGKGPLMITPTFSIDVEATTENELEFMLDLDLSVLSARLWLEVLGFDVVDQSIGPLFSETFPLAAGSLFSLGDSTFDLNGFQSEILGETFTFFPAATTFVSNASNNVNWGFDGNWTNGVGDNGNAVVIEEDKFALIRGGLQFSVGNMAIGQGAEVSIQSGSILEQDAGPAVMTFSNEGEIFVSGTLIVATPLSGGGDIRIFDGSNSPNGVQSVISGPIDLQGQRIRGQGKIDAAGEFNVDADSSVTAEFGNLWLLVNNVSTTVNRGEIGAETLDNGSNLNWRSRSTSSNTYTIDNRGGVIASRTGNFSAGLVLRHDGPAGGLDNGSYDTVRIVGGLLETDQSPFSESFIRTFGTLWLDGRAANGADAAITTNGNIRADRLALSGSITNNYKLRGDTIIVGRPIFDAFTGDDLTIGGTGRLELRATTLEVGSGCCSPSLPVLGLTNEAGHSIVGDGAIGNPAAPALAPTLRVVNDGLVAASTFSAGGVLTLQPGFAPGAEFVNNGVLQAGWTRPETGTDSAGTLILGSGRFNLAGGTVHALHGDVTVTPAANLSANRIVGGVQVFNPGGTWKASAGRTISLQANDWIDLIDFTGWSGDPVELPSALRGKGMLRHAEIVLEQADSNLNVEIDYGTGTFDLALAGLLGRIGDGGTLTLVDRVFEPEPGGVPFGNLIESASLVIESGGTLALDNATFRTNVDFLDRETLELFGITVTDGATTIEQGGQIVGNGELIVDVVANAGTVRAEGGILKVTGEIGGAGLYAAGIGSKLDVDVALCGFLWGPCASGGSLAEAALSGGNFLVTADATQASMLEFSALVFDTVGALGLVKIETLSDSQLEISGALASVMTVVENCSSLGNCNRLEQDLGETLAFISGGSSFTLSDGAQFLSTTPAVQLTGSVMALAGAATAYAGNNLNVAADAAVSMRGGALSLANLVLSNGATFEGFGVLDAAAIDNQTRIVADNGTLELRDSIVTQTGPAGALEARAVDLAGPERDAPSILRLNNTTVTGGTLDIGRGALLNGGGSLQDVDTFNQGVILAGGAGNGALVFGEAGEGGLSTSLVNLPGSLVQVNDGQLVLRRTTVVNTTTLENRVRPRIAAVAAAGDSQDAVITLAGSNVSGGELLLQSFVPPDPVAGEPPPSPAKIAILEGYGSLTNVNMAVGGGSLVDANVSGETLKFDIGSGHITNLGTMQASKAFGLPAAAPGGILEIVGGTVSGTGELVARDASTVLLRDVNLDGVALRQVDSGRIIDVATSTFTNLSVQGLFEVEGHATLRGSVNNEGGTIRVTSGGVVTIADGDERFRESAPGSGILVSDGIQEFALQGGATGGKLIVDTGGIVTGAGALFTVNDSSLVLNGGTMAGSASLVFIKGNSGRLEGSGVVQTDVFNEGTIAAQNLTIGGRLLNNGAIVVDETVQPTSQITALMFNNAGGTILSQGNQDLQFSFTGNPFFRHVNNSTISSFNGGKIGFQGRLLNNNDGQIFMNSGWLEFDDGLLNDGGTVLVSEGSGNVLFGDINNTVAGTITLTGASQTTFFDALLNDGLLQVQTGSIAVFAGNVTGSGLYAGTGMKFFEGGFSPGSSPGLVSSEGDTVFGANALIEMEIGGSEQGNSYDHYRVGGRLDLGGTLKVSLLDDYAPEAGDTFDLFDAFELVGGFAEFDLGDARLSGKLRWDLSALGTSGTLSVAAVPLPAGIWMMVPALAGLGACRRRRGNGESQHETR